MRPALVSALAVLVIDQLSKLWVLQVMDLERLGRVEVLPPFLEFRMAWNRGINFGLLSGDSDIIRWVLIAIAFGMAAFFLIWSRRTYQHRLARVSAGVLAGGAIGNGLDRLRFGAVADFLNVSCCGIDNPYAFNIADVAIFIGVAGIVVLGCWRAEDRGH